MEQGLWWDGGHSSGTLCLAGRVALALPCCRARSSSGPAPHILLSHSDVLPVCYCSLVIPVHCQSSLQPVASAPVSLQVHADGFHLSFTRTGVCSLLILYVFLGSVVPVIFFLPFSLF